MVRYVVTGAGFDRYDTLVDKLGRLDSKSSSWYTTINEAQVLNSYIEGETRQMTLASFKPGLVSAFDRLLEAGYLKEETI